MPDKEELYDEAIDLYADGKYDEAIAMYQSALEQDPRYTDALHGMVMCYQAKGDLDTAIEQGDDKGSRGGGRRSAAPGLEAPAQGRRGREEVKARRRRR